MFEEYLRDTAHFLSEARQASESGAEEESRRSYRVSIMLGCAAMETFVNFIASTFETAGSDTLQPYELGLLADRRFGQRNGVFQLQDQPAYSRLEDKLRFLINHFPVKLDLSRSREWAEFLEFKRLRDKLVHARRDEDETPLATYDTACSEGVHATFALMNLLSEGIFDRPLRAKLHDLMDFPDGT